MREDTKTAIQLVGLIEAVALAIALVMPVTPSKTGGDMRLASIVFENPTYLHEVLVSFVLVNLIVGVLAAVFLLTSRKRGSDVGDAPNRRE